jgi:hypothetical protein
MNITSYNVTDVGYHYIGLRVLGGLPLADRAEQTRTVSRNVLKYARDKALRLMLPEPRGSFETVGEKVCQELVHFGFAHLVHNQGYELTEAGKSALDLLNTKEHMDLRRAMVRAHVRAYENLRNVLAKHIAVDSIFSPIVETPRVGATDYLVNLLSPTFGGEAETELASVLNALETRTAKKLEDALRQRVLRQTLKTATLSVPLFRSMCDRLVSLRLLNIMKATIEGCEFARSYSPCVLTCPPRDWYHRLDVDLGSGATYVIYLSEPDMQEAQMQQRLLHSLGEAFSQLTPQAGYFDLPGVRDFVCEKLRIPEASFDEGINVLLDRQPCPLTTGLGYERITGRRKPLVRTRDSVQVFNLIRRA